MKRRVRPLVIAAALTVATVASAQAAEDAGEVLDAGPDCDYEYGDTGCDPAGGGGGGAGAPYGDGGCGCTSTPAAALLAALALVIAARPRR